MCVCDREREIDRDRQREIHRERWRDIERKGEQRATGY